MPGSLRAGLAVTVLMSAFSSVHAADAPASGAWLTDPANHCAVFATGAGERVAWTGPCEEGLATGLGTATFFQSEKEVESFTADFDRGMIADGHVISRWGNGWSYDGDTVHGRFNGGGVLINDKQDRYLGLWADGKMNGFGLLDRADGSRYAGEWKNDLPNGEGELRRADGSVVEGMFLDGKLVTAHVAATPDPALKPAALSQSQKPAAVAAAPFAALQGVTLKGVDGSAIALNPIEGGIEMALTAAGGMPQKTTFTFMTDRLGTVVEDGGHGANVTGFFRLTETGVELHYADGRAETLSATQEGGVAMVLTRSDARATCRSWYPAGHIFSDSEKKAALADYAARLGLAAAAASDSAPCNMPIAAPAKLAPETVTVVPRPAVADKRPASRPRAVKTAFTPARPMAPSRPANRTGLTPVMVKDSQVHTIDDMVPAPAAGATLPSSDSHAEAKPDGSDPSRCLKVDSDGLNWGFRNACGFAVQFAYCVPADSGLAACGKGGAPGSVAAHGFGALMADKSLSENGVDHSFRWIACAGGAGEVVAHLDRADPPSGRCDRAAPEIAAAR
ncbi:MAG: hypothetical protein JO256_03720 [Alphaproteobacteria bacterium]|nr:hypothetical protein [Alphaproteobacteria bacterium]